MSTPPKPYKTGEAVWRATLIGGFIGLLLGKLVYGMIIGLVIGTMLDSSNRKKSDRDHHS